LGGGGDIHEGEVLAGKRTPCLVNQTVWFIRSVMQVALIGSVKLKSFGNCHVGEKEESFRNFCLHDCSFEFPRIFDRGCLQMLRLFIFFFAADVFVCLFVSLGLFNSTA
jgi:hypothetical protein